MTLSNQALDQFRDAWHAAEGEDFASRLQRQSLEALASENDALRPVLFELMNRAPAMHLSMFRQPMSSEESA